MQTGDQIWVRAETRPDEKRAPLTPQDAKILLAAGQSVVVEDCPHRTISTDHYQQAGCKIVGRGTWRQAPTCAWILGLKELPDDDELLHHRHVYFAHAYKDQAGADALLRRFSQNGGALFDLEYLTDFNGRRVVAFGYWAGYVGAALGILAEAGALGPIAPTRQEDLQRQLTTVTKAVTDLRTIIIGAKGRCGQGAQDALRDAGVTGTLWDLAETQRLDKAALLDHHLLINTVGMTAPTAPFVCYDDLSSSKRNLSTIVDVTCDVNSPCHALPVYDRLTSWSEPLRCITAASLPPVDVIAIDNLPSLLPHNSSVDFSSQLVPHLLHIGRSNCWQEAAAVFQKSTSHHQSFRQPEEVLSHA